MTKYPRRDTSSSKPGLPSSLGWKHLVHLVTPPWADLLLSSRAVSIHPAPGTPEAPRRNYKSHEALGRGMVMTKPPRIGHAGRGAQAFSEGRGGARGGASGGCWAGTPPGPPPPPRQAPLLHSLPGQRAGARRWRRRTIICSSCC